MERRKTGSPRENQPGNGRMLSALRIGVGKLEECWLRVECHPSGPKEHLDHHPICGSCGRSRCRGSKFPGVVHAGQSAMFRLQQSAERSR